MCRVLSVYKELPASAVLLDTPMPRDAHDLEVVVVDIPEAVVLPYEWITETRSHRRFMVPAGASTNIGACGSERTSSDSTCFVLHKREP